jgi:hypothetical protein
VIREKSATGKQRRQPARPAARHARIFSKHDLNLDPNPHSFFVDCLFLFARDAVLQHILFVEFSPLSMRLRL